MPNDGGCRTPQGQMNQDKDADDWTVSVLCVDY